MVPSRSASPKPVLSGFMRTHRSRPSKSSVSSQRSTIPRASAFFSTVTASSKSRINASAGSVSALAIIFSFPPGTKWNERLAFMPRNSVSGGLTGHPAAHHLLRGRGGSREPAAHHGGAPAAHDDLAALVLRPVLEDHDPPLGPRARFALLDHLGLGVDGVAVEHRLGKLHLLEAQVPDRRAERGVPHGEPHGGPR